MRNIIAICIILTMHSCNKSILTKEEITQIRTISLEKLVKDYTSIELIENGKTIVIDTYLSDSLYLSIWKNRFFGPKWLDTINDFKRSEYEELIKKNNIATFSSNELQINENSNSVKLNITKNTRDNYLSNDTIGSLCFRPIIFDANKNISIQILHFYRGVEDAVTLALYFRMINGEWRVQGSKILSIS